MRDLGVDVRNPLYEFWGPQNQGRHAAFKIQVSSSKNYGNCARNRVFDPLDVRLSVRKPPAEAVPPCQLFYLTRWLRISRTATALVFLALCRLLGLHWRHGRRCWDLRRGAGHGAGRIFARCCAIGCGAPHGR